MTIAHMQLQVDVRKHPSEEAFGQLSLNSDQILSGDTSRAYRFNIVKGGRALWEQWFKAKSVFVSYEDSTVYQADIVAFPTNPKTDYGYIQLVRAA